MEGIRLSDFSLVLAFPAYAQIIPRAPVVQVGHQVSGSGPTPTPTPPPLPDPSGVYDGTAQVHLEGQSTFEEEWIIVVKAQPCAECKYGEHFFSGTNYVGSSYTSGAGERGPAASSPSTGTTVGMELFAINCP